jgi:hypothetical protein
MPFSYFYNMFYRLHVGAKGRGPYLTRGDETGAGECMGEMRFARQRRGGPSRYKGNKVCTSFMFDSRGLCVCSRASRREMSIDDVLLSA